MQQVKLYRYESPNCITVTPIQRSESDVQYAVRLIADEGKELTKDGINMCPCVDVSDADGWYEVDAVIEPESLPEELNYNDQETV